MPNSALAETITVKVVGAGILDTDNASEQFILNGKFSLNLNNDALKGQGTGIINISGYTTSSFGFCDSFGSSSVTYSVTGKKNPTTGMIEFSLNDFPNISRTIDCGNLTVEQSSAYPLNFGSNVISMDPSIGSTASKTISGTNGQTNWKFFSR